MTRIFVVMFFFAFILLSCKTVKKPIVQKTSDFSWLEGNWNRVDTEEGESGHETWEIINAENLKGEGFMIREFDMAFMELLEIKKIDQKYVYLVEMQNGDITPFEIKEINTNSFSCYNASNDFPKKISYSLSGSRLTAIISGDEKSKSFYFERSLEDE